MNILALDTSNKPMTVSIVSNGTLLALKTVNIKRNHSIQLMPAIEEVIEESEIGKDSINRIVVAKGPGSYTGVRIAVTVAKTLAWTLQADIVGVSSLEVIAMSGLKTPGTLVSPVINARRNNLYTALYRVNDDLTLTVEESPRHVSGDEWWSLVNKYDELVEFVGLDVENFWDQIQTQVVKSVYYKQINQSPSAFNVALLGENKAVEDIHSFTPEYLKLAEAEENWLKENPEKKREDFIEKI